jgi:ubiquinone/menaquinone biosynthesis C-methylase UbiE
MCEAHRYSNVGPLLYCRLDMINVGFFRRYTMTRKVGDPGTPAENPLAEPWNLVADGYTSDVLRMMEHFAHAALSLADLPPSPHVVDVATGPGTLAFLAASDGATVSAIDFSPGMIASFRRREERAGLQFADVRIGDGQDLPYENDSFDGAFSIHGLIFFPDRDAGFRELRRVLRPGCHAVVSSMASLSNQFVTAVECLGFELPDLELRQAELPLSIPETFIHEMSAAGFRHVTVHTVEYVETLPSVSHFWAKVQNAAAFVVQLRHRFGDQYWAKVSNNVLIRLEQVLGVGPVEEVYRAHLGVGVK